MRPRAERTDVLGRRGVVVDLQPFGVPCLFDGPVDVELRVEPRGGVHATLVLDPPCHCDRIAVPWAGRSVRDVVRLQIRRAGHEWFRRASDSLLLVERARERRDLSRIVCVRWPLRKGHRNGRDRGLGISGQRRGVRIRRDRCRPGPGLSRERRGNRILCCLQRPGQGRSLLLVAGCHCLRFKGQRRTDGSGCSRVIRRQWYVGQLRSQNCARESVGCCFGPGHVFPDKGSRDGQDVTGCSLRQNAGLWGKRPALGLDLTRVISRGVTRCFRHRGHLRRFAPRDLLLLSRSGRSCRPRSLCSRRVNLRDLNPAVVLPIVARRQLAHQFSSAVGSDFVDVLPSVLPVGDEDRHFTDCAPGGRGLLMRHFRLLLATAGEHGCRDQHVGDAEETRSDIQRSSGSIPHLSLLKHDFPF